MGIIAVKGEIYGVIIQENQKVRVKIWVLDN